MAGENSDEIYTPSRRALLKAAAAGGVFAVPLIASFSLDTASAQTRANAFGSSNQMISSNMFCSNMTGVPTAVFYAELQEISASTGQPTGPVAGLAGFEFVQGSDELFYELVVEGSLVDFSVFLGPHGTGGFFEDTTSSKVGAVPGSSLNCGPYSLNTVYQDFAAGGSIVQVDLAGGTRLFGTIVPLDPSGPFRNSFHFAG